MVFYRRKIIKVITRIRRLFSKEHIIQINLNKLNNEQAIKLSCLFQREMQVAITQASCQHRYKLDLQDEDSICQTQEDEEAYRTYAAIMKDAYEQLLDYGYKPKKLGVKFYERSHFT